MHNFYFFYELLQESVKGKKGPSIQVLIEEYGKNPFLILVSCLLSLRTRDSVTLLASRRLFTYAKTPQELLTLDYNTLENLIYPVGFYSRKAHQLGAICTVLIEKYGGKVPFTKEELLALPGVGIKTTNLVLAEAFDIPAICVDTHVHKISNQIGLVETKTAEQTEMVLKKIIPLSYQRDFSRYMVLLGQSPKKIQYDFIEKAKELI